MHMWFDLLTLALAIPGTVVSIIAIYQLVKRRKRK